MIEGFDPLLPHLPTQKETETLELIQALLQRGGKIIGGSQWVNNLEKEGYFLIKVELEDQLYIFKSPMSLPFIIGPSQSQ